MNDGRVPPETFAQYLAETTCGVPIATRPAAENQWSPVNAGGPFS